MATKKVKRVSFETKIGGLSEREWKKRGVRTFTFNFSGGGDGRWVADYLAEAATISTDVGVDLSQLSNPIGGLLTVYAELLKTKQSKIESLIRKWKIEFDTADEDNEQDLMAGFVELWNVLRMLGTQGAETYLVADLLTAVIDVWQLLTPWKKKGPLLMPKRRAA